jgi:hypothetical protein
MLEGRASAGLLVGEAGEPRGRDWRDARAGTDAVAMPARDPDGRIGLDPDRA